MNPLFNFDPALLPSLLRFKIYSWFYVSCWTGLNGERELLQRQQEVNGSPVACFYDMHISAHTDRCILIIGACDIAICGQTNEAESEGGGVEGGSSSKKQQSESDFSTMDSTSHLTLAPPGHRQEAVLWRLWFIIIIITVKSEKESVWVAVTTVNVTIITEDISRSFCLKQMNTTLTQLKICSAT